MPSKGQRTVLSLSLSPANPDAVTVATALKERNIEKGKRTAAILTWAAAYLQGKGAEEPIAVNPLGLSEEEIDALLDDF